MLFSLLSTLRQNIICVILFSVTKYLTRNTTTRDPACYRWRCKISFDVTCVYMHVCFTA